jgi:hypothetical protein
LLICNSRRDWLWVNTERKWEQQAAVKLQVFTLWDGQVVAHDRNCPFP